MEPIITVGWDDLALDSTLTCDCFYQLILGFELIPVTTKQLEQLCKGEALQLTLSLGDGTADSTASLRWIELDDVDGLLETIKIQSPDGNCRQSEHEILDEQMYRFLEEHYDVRF